MKAILAFIESRSSWAAGSIIAVSGLWIAAATNVVVTIPAILSTLWFAMLVFVSRKQGVEGSFVAGSAGVAAAFFAIAAFSQTVVAEWASTTGYVGLLAALYAFVLDTLFDPSLRSKYKL